MKPLMSHLFDLLTSRETVFSRNQPEINIYRVSGLNFPAKPLKYVE